jgi:hypothetical protein
VAQIWQRRTAAGYFSCASGGLVICAGSCGAGYVPCDYVGTLGMQCSDGTSGQVDAQPDNTGTYWNSSLASNLGELVDQLTLL